MQISRENTGENTATIRVEIGPDDYREAVTKALKEFQRKANIPGFRPGKVPYGMIKKMYGKSVMADEVNKLLGDALSGYMKDENLDILGNPLPDKEKSKLLRFEEEETLEFFFDIGLVPEIKVELGPGFTVENYTIRIDDEMAETYIRSEQKRHGVFSHPETAGETDMIKASIQPVTETGEAIEGQEPKTVHIHLESVAGPSVREKLMALTPQASQVIQPVGFFGSDEEAAKHLSLPVTTFSDPALFCSIKVDEITHIDPAERNAEFFAKLYPGETIETEEELLNRMKHDLSASFNSETDKYLYQEIVEKLVETTDVRLPDAFLVKWLAEHEENKLSEEEITRQYPSFARSMKWQLIENKIIKEHAIHVAEEDIRTYIRTYILRQANLDFVDPEMEKKYETIVDAFMQNEEQVQKINDQLFSEKLMRLFREKINLEPREVTYDEFLQITTDKHLKHHDHDHEHDHEHDHKHE